MTNLEVIKNFLQKKNAQTNLRNILNGYYSYKGRTLQTQKQGDEFQLINYSTVIATIKENKLFLNIHKYSATTSKIQSQLAYLASLTDYVIYRYDNKGGE